MRKHHVHTPPPLTLPTPPPPLTPPSNDGYHRPLSGIPLSVYYRVPYFLYGVRDSFIAKHSAAFPNPNRPGSASTLTLRPTSWEFILRPVHSVFFCFYFLFLFYKSKKIITTFGTPLCYCFNHKLAYVINLSR